VPDLHFRDLRHCSHILLRTFARTITASEDPNKKASADDLLKMESRLKQDASYVGEGSLNRRDAAQTLAKARAIVGDSAFSKDGRILVGLGDVTETFKADLMKFEDKKAGAAADGEGGGAESAAGEGGTPKKKDGGKDYGSRTTNQTVLHCCTLEKLISAGFPGFPRRAPAAPTVRA
jgi:hypothetical protein